MKRHLYRRKIGTTESGKPIRAWYYWYYDPETKKQVRKSCGNSKQPVLLKYVAEAIIAELEEQDRKDQGLKGETESVTLKVLAEQMFTEHSLYLKRMRQNNYFKTDATLKEIKSHLNNWIIPHYGHLRPEQVDPIQVENDLISVDRSNSWRNRNVSIINFILDEAIRHKMIRYKPIFQTFKHKKGKKDILSIEEMERLFPDDFEGLSMVWDKKGKVSDEGFMFGALYALMVSTGLRNGEARAIHPSQFIVFDGKTIETMIDPAGSVRQFEALNLVLVYGLIVDRMYNAEGKIVKHLKKGDEADDPKLRVTVIPEKTVKYVQHWMMIQRTPLHDLVFTFEGRRIRSEYLEDRFALGLKNAGIHLEQGRVLTPHSLRFTYNTKMRRLISGEHLRLMTGHESEQMTDYYTRIKLEEQFLDLQGNSSAINEFWGESRTRTVLSD
ncbi:MAG: site-specific integrase [Treponema sp.]|jgi:integrase|nr:site-specific integrase [Treponema sp.]